MRDLSKSVSSLEALASAPVPHAAEPAKLLVVSPHLDDAVFSCGALLAGHPGSIVCTVFCGVPREPQHTSWDEAAGFADSDEAMRARSDEDDRALELCHARPWRLPFLDGQYGETPSARAIAAELAHLFERFPGHVPVVPLGLYHSDHQRVGAAWEILVRARRLERWVAYEDAIYRAIDGTVRARLEQLSVAGMRARPLPDDWLAPRGDEAAAAVKRRSVGAYRSQLRAFGTPWPADLGEPERYWLLEAAEAPLRSRARS